MPIARSATRVAGSLAGWSSPSIWPLVAGARYLSDTRGTPFPLLVRVSWALQQLNAASLATYLNDTVTKGFTAIQFFVNWFADYGAPLDSDGNLPWSKRLDGGNWTGALTYTNAANEAPDFATPVEAFWANIDEIVDAAAARNLAVLYFPLYMGFYSDDAVGWKVAAVANGTTKCENWGAWIASRWQYRRNVIWMLGGDLGGTNFTTPQKNVTSAFIDGLQTVAGKHYSNEWHGPSIGQTDTDFRGDLTISGCYSFQGETGTYCRNAYSSSTPQLPCYLQEGPFDQDGPDGLDINANATQPIRRFSWWAWLNSIAGYSLGNSIMSAFVTDDQSQYYWADNINTTQMQHHAIMNAFIKSVEWHTLVPDGLGSIGTLVTANKGTIDTTDYVAAAANPAGTLLVAYCSSASGNPTIDMTKMSGTVTARWFDPTSGDYTSIGTYANTGTQSFTPPATNDAGEGDWVLRLDA